MIQAGRLRRAHRRPGLGDRRPDLGRVHRVGDVVVARRSATARDQHGAVWKPCFHVIRARKGHGGDLPPSRRGRRHVDHIGGSRGRAIAPRIGRRARLEDLPRQVHGRRMRVEDSRIDRRPRLCRRVEHPAGEGLLGGPGHEDPSIGEHEHMRIPRHAEACSFEHRPRTRRWIVDLRDIRIATLATYFSSEHQHAAVGQTRQRRIPPAVGHVGRGTPEVRPRIEDASDGQAAVVIGVTSRGEQPAVGQREVAGAEEIGAIVRGNGRERTRYRDPRSVGAGCLIHLVPRAAILESLWPGLLLLRARRVQVPRRDSRPGRSGTKRRPSRKEPPGAEGGTVSAPASVVNVAFVPTRSFPAASLERAQ